MNRKQRRAAAKSGGPITQLLTTGLRLHQAGKLAEAEACYRQALPIRPNMANLHLNLGQTLMGQGKLNDAIAAYRQAIRIKPELAMAHLGLGNALMVQGKLDEATAAYRQALLVKPDLAEAYANLGAVLTAQVKLDDAVAAYRRAIEINPDYAAAYSNLGYILTALGKLDEAVATCRRAIGIKPDFAGAHSNLAMALTQQGKLDQAVAAYRQAIRVDPSCAGAFSGLLLCLNYDDRSTNEDLFAAHREWDQRYGQPLQRPKRYANDRDPSRRLRIGYLSADFRQHSVAYFLEPLLRGHNRHQVDVFCYADVSQPDSTTTHLKSLADHWLMSVGLSDQTLAEQIQADGIDILVDLAGHTSGGRLLVFARKPAPVQATWLGYPNTTGLKAIDYRIIDPVTDPVGDADHWASETLVRLEGGFLCYDAPKSEPEPTSPPSFETGTLTFGSFNNPAKVSTATLDTWARLLLRLPRARLLLKGRPFADAGTSASFLARLGERGVAPERVELAAYLPNTAEHLALYHRVDIALDPFPYNGTTTTCEALWMGVPVVTLRGHRHAGRVGASLLTQVGLTDWIADSPEEYVEIALALAGNPVRLHHLRRTLRPRMAASSLCDVSAFACKMEAAFRTMWQNWC